MLISKDLAHLYAIFLCYLEDGKITKFESDTGHPHPQCFVDEASRHSCFNIVFQEKERKKQETIGAREQDVALAFTKEVELQKMPSCCRAHWYFRKLKTTYIYLLT